MPDSRFDNVKYVCWLKVCIALLFAKEGLEKLTDELALTFHNKLKKRLGEKRCVSCSKHDLKNQWSKYKWNCKANVCNVWLEKIRSYLPTNKTSIEWDNSDISCLPTSSWECLKLFMPFGCKDITEAAKADIAAILTLYINNSFFLKRMGGVVAKDTLEKVKDIRRNIMHSCSLEIEETQMKDYIDAIIMMLQCHTQFALDQSCQDAITRIKELQSAKLEISKHKEFELRSLNARVKTTERSLDKSQHDIEILRDEIEDRKTSRTEIDYGIDDVKTKFHKLKKEIKAVVEYIDRFSKFIENNAIEGVCLGRLVDKKTALLKQNDEEMETDIMNLNEPPREFGLWEKKRSDDTSRDIEELKSNKSQKMMSYEERKKEKKDYDQLLTDISMGASSLQTYLQEKKLPTNEDLQKAHALYRNGLLGRDKLDAMCDIICTHIKKRSHQIKTIWPSYKSNSPTNVVFVVICEKPFSFQYEYNIKTHVIGSCSDEAKEVMYHKDAQNKQFSVRDSTMITSTIDKHAKMLMKKHSNICMISACLLKSIGFGTDKARITQDMCIVIYVDIKGFIPIHEELLPVDLKVPNSDQIIPVDVRESEYQSLHGPQDFHQNVKHGCMITGINAEGTLGGFIDVKGNTYALTSAHIFLKDNSSFESCLKNDKIYNNIDGQYVDKVYVYQNKPIPGHQIGYIVYAAINQGGLQSSGVDIAVIRLTETARFPVSGLFPEGNTEHAGFTINEPMEYTSGLIYDQYTFTEQAEKSSEAFKFGSATGCTKGTFVIQGSCVRTIEYHDSSMDLGLPLFKQYEVQSLVNQEIEQFAAPGDSGALVFAKHDGKRTDLRVVGMVEGRTNHNTCVVTPIKAIFDNLGEIDRRFKVFRQHAFGPEIPISSPDNYLRDARIHNQQIEQNLLQELSKRESGLKQEQKESERRLTNTIETIERKVDTQIEQNLELSKRISGLEQEQKESERRLTNTIETFERKVDTKLDCLIDLMKKKNDT